jgi:protein-disulfide isomerase
MRAKSRQSLGIVFAGFLLFPSGAAVAQVSRDEFEALKTEVGQLREAVKSQTEVLRQLLQRLGALRENREAPFQEATISVGDAAVYGKSDAKVTIIEFSDYQCPFCARYSNEIFPQIDRDFFQTGRVKYVFRDFPIESIHPQALKAHEAVHCAGEQGKGREMHSKVFANQRAMSLVDLSAHARAAGLDMAGFQKCLESGLQASKIRKGMREGQEVGVTGTPTFFLGLTGSDSLKVKAVRRIVGAQPYSVFKAAIEELLSSP